MTTMEYHRPDSDDRFEQISRSLMCWVLGAGLLSVHVGVYLVTLVVLLLWNFARSPSDVWVDGPLRRWGLVVVFHATAVAAGWAAWRLMRLGEAAVAPASRARDAQPMLPATDLGASPEAYGSPVRTGTPATTSAAWARRWLRESVRIVRDAVDPSDATNGHQSDGHAPRPSASAVAGPEITEWATLFTRRAREMMASARDRVASTPQASDGSSPAAPVENPADPAVNWPSDAEPPRPATENGTWPAPTNGAVHADDAFLGAGPGNGVAQHAPLQFTTVDTPGTDDEPGDDAPVSLADREDARWSWVEGAAAAWLARREMDDPPVDPVEAPPPPADESTASP